MSEPSESDVAVHQYCTVEGSGGHLAPPARPFDFDPVVDALPCFSCCRASNSITSRTGTASAL